MTDNKKEQERNELHRTIWAIADGTLRLLGRMREASENRKKWMLSGENIQVKMLLR